jgi:hypothetical protein
MGIGRIWRDWRRGWGEADLARLREKLDDPKAWSGSVIRLTPRAYRALHRHNVEMTQSAEARAISPLTVWVEGFGVRLARRVIAPLNRPA